MRRASPGVDREERLLQLPLQTPARLFLRFRRNALDGRLPWLRGHMRAAGSCGWGAAPSDGGEAAERGVTAAPGADAVPGAGAVGAGITRTPGAERRPLRRLLGRTCAHTAAQPARAL
ncbi:hypothetical protein NDU88_001821 [Pleurodeles waltl]|uniref:Uncharacterized protein n=1 Tax=Pleurodeles waltl TaxID=8319 RepID=A0AAV7SA23_PLEWA|nr:hypothetical protein NDU88_001821 [Pleurodeles waltl]